MKDLHPEVSLERLCGLFDKSRQAFHQRLRLIYAQAVEKDFIIEAVRKIRCRQPRIGGRKLLVLLKQQGIQVGRDAFFDLLGSNCLLVRRRRNGTRTTQSSHWLRKYPNLVRHFEPNAPNQLWVSDITYLETTQGFMYLFLITDAYSKKILGFSLADDLEAGHAVAALKMAFRTMKADCPGLIHHSDRGVQYCSNEYVQVLNKRSVALSMTENGDPLENAIAERINGILKDEWLYELGKVSKAVMTTTVPKIIQIYNAERPHLSLNMLTPDQAHQLSGKLKKLWKNYYHSATDCDKHKGNLSTN
jgi:putative transposase